MSGRASWNALAVLRNDANSQFGTFNTWALSGGYRLTPTLRAVASSGTSFQAPTLNQLYFPGYGVATRTPQTSMASEFGLRYTQGDLVLGAVAYYNEVKGFIVPSTNTQSDLAVLRGVTLSSAFQNSGIHYIASYDYADPRTQPDYLRVVRVAQHVANFRLTGRSSWGNWFGELKLSSDREDAKLNSSILRETLAGYGLVNVGASWQINKDLTMQARLNNLTDAHYMLANGYSVPGANLFVALAWTL